MVPSLVAAAVRAGHLYGAKAAMTTKGATMDLCCACAVCIVQTGCNVIHGGASL